MPKFDPFYARTLPGILKIVRMVLDLLGFISIMCSGVYAWLSRASWYSFVSMTGFWVTGILLLFYFFHLIERAYFLPWMLMESIFCAIWTIFYLIAACLVAALGGAIEAYAAAAFFGFSAMLVYGFDAFLKFKGWREGEVAQGERHTSTVASPTAY